MIKISNNPYPAYETYPKPIPLRKALQKLRQNGENFADIFIKNVSKDDSLASQNVKSYLNRGSSAIIFETPDGKILKLTDGNHFPLNRPHESFDVPVYKQGHIGNVYYYFEEKLYQHGLSEGFVGQIKENIRKKGYRTFDINNIDIHQIGLSKEGNLYLLDAECARYKTIFHALFDKMKRFILKRF